MKAMIWKMVMVVFLGIMVVSCAGYDNYECYQTVLKVYKDIGVVYIIPDTRYKFIVLTKDGEVRYVRTNNRTNTDITHNYLLFKVAE